MRKFRRCSACCAVLLTQVGTLSADDGTEFFERRIRPVLVAQCYECHSAEAVATKKLKGGLQLDSRQQALAGGDTGPAVVPGEADASLLIRALRHEDGLEMPPQGKLPDHVIADFVKWIELGAPDPRAKGTTTPPDDENAQPGRDHWAFQRPRIHALPQVKSSGWPKAPWDHFVLARLEQRGLEPIGLASKRELLRRLTFDLIGLPPTNQEVEAFIEDDSPGAYLKVVDRLLASPHYGERWGRAWLDVARYADDKALAYHNPWPHAYRYRDWVVKALNDDLPYDLFVRLQVAGDLMSAPGLDHATRLAGLGFQGLGAFYHKGSVPEQVKADEIDDRVDTLSRGLLGLTVACARCHDHKYDPIATRDYYSLAAAYNGATWAEVKMAGPEEIAEHEAWAKKKKELEDGLQQWLVEQGDAIARRELNRTPSYLLAAWQSHLMGRDPEAAAAEQLQPFFLSRWTKLLAATDMETKPQVLAGWARTARLSTGVGAEVEAVPPVPEPLRKASEQLMCELRSALDAHDRNVENKKSNGGDNEDKNRGKDDASKLTPRQKELLTAVWLDKDAPFHVTPKDVPSLLDAPRQDHHDSLKSGLGRHQQAEPLNPPMAHGVVGGGEAMHVLVRGNVNRPGEVAPPRFLPILQHAGTAAAKERFTRLELAEAICTADNPLTARVIVNRIWQHHFGQGIVATASNFGLLGDRPTHPELLDTLTIRFVQSGWSLKWLHRQIVTTAAYRLSSHDQTNTARHREVDPENRLLWRFSPRRIPVESWRDSVLAISGQLDRSMGGSPVGRAEDDHRRRTIYSTISRREPDKMLVTFDFPDANVTNERRDVTTVPQQQLFVLNSQFMLTSAKHLASLAAQDGNEETQRIKAIYRLALARDPSAEELQQATEFLALVRSDEQTLDGWQQLAQAVLASNEFSWID